MGNEAHGEFVVAEDGMLGCRSGKTGGEGGETEIWEEMEGGERKPRGLDVHCSVADAALRRWPGTPIPGTMISLLK